MHGRRRDARVSPSQLFSVEDVGQLALAVADPVADDGVFLLGAQVVEGDAAGRVAFEAEGGVADDADVGIRLGGGALEGG